MQQGGGIGYDFSTLRPKGAPVRGVGADASGPLSFMDVWDAMCRTIMSAGACLLGSINLARLVRSPFTPHAHLDPAELANLVGVAVRMMDNTIDVSGFPLEQQRQEASAKRRIGLGMTGLADALVMVGLRYGSKEAAERAGEWARQISRAAYSASAHLAGEKGTFPLFDRDAYLAGETIRELDDDVRDLIAQHGI